MNAMLYTARVTLSTGSKTFANDLSSIIRMNGMKSKLQVSRNRPIGFKDERKGSKTTSTLYNVRLNGYHAKLFYEFIYNDVPEGLSMKHKRDKFSDWYDKYSHIYKNGPAPKAHNAIHASQLSMEVK